MVNYVELKAVNSGNQAQFGVIQNYRNRLLLKEGKSLAAGFPADASFVMDPDFPNAVALPDVLYTMGSMLVINQKVRDVLEARAVPDIEFLPVNIVNHKGRKTKEQYVLVNMLRIVDCVDRAKTKHTLNPLAPDKMVDVSDVVLDEKKIDKDTQLFRPLGLAVLMVARRDLGDHLKAAKVTGLGVGEIVEFKS